MFCCYALYVYLWTEYAPSESLSALFYSVFYFGITLLITLENRETKVIQNVYDAGFLFYLFLPLLLPYYLYKCRGIAGLIWLVPILFVMFIEIVGYELWILTNPDDVAN